MGWFKSKTIQASEIDDLWRRCKSGGSSEARDEIIVHYTYLAKYVVDRLNLRPSAVLGKDDLESHAIVGLIDAVERFDPSRENKFETYAVVRIRGAVLDAIKQLDWMPRSVRSTELALRRTFASLEAQYGRPATDEEVAEAMGMDIDKLQDALADVGQSAIQSLEELMIFGEETSESGFGAKSDPDRDPVLAAEICERKRLLAMAIETLPDKEKLVISLYYKEGLTLKEIAAVLGVSESRACQLHSKAVVRLHGRLARHAELLMAAA